MTLFLCILINLLTTLNYLMFIMTSFQGLLFVFYELFFLVISFCQGKSIAKTLLTKWNPGFAFRKKKNWFELFGHCILILLWVEAYNAYYLFVK